MQASLLLSPCRAGCPVLAQKCFNFSTLRGGESAAETGAFQRRSRGCEPQRLPQILLLGDGEGESAVKHVARAQGIHGMHREGRRLVQVLLLVEPERAFRAARARQERRRQFGNFLERFAVVG